MIVFVFWEEDRTKHFYHLKNIKVDSSHDRRYYPDKTRIPHSFYLEVDVLGLEIDELIQLLVDRLQGLPVL